MASRKNKVTDVRSMLAQEYVEPLFEKLPAAREADGAIPELVLENRRRRARERVVDALESRGSTKVEADLQKRLKTLVKDWAGRGFSDAFPSVEEFEIEMARDRELVLARESGDQGKLLAALEADLRRRVEEEYGRIELRGLQTGHRMMVDLEEFYVPLYLERAQAGQEPEKEKFLEALSPRRASVEDVLREHRRVLIVGAPGSGKSTLVAYLAAKCAKRNLATHIGEQREGLAPLALRVRALTGVSLTPKGIAGELSLDAGLVEWLLDAGRAILFLDGLDETGVNQREALLASLHRLTSRYPELRIVATSRPAGPPGEIEKQANFLEAFHLSDLTPPEVDRYIEDWCVAAETSIRADKDAARKDALAAAEDLKSRVASSPAIQRIASNLLLTTVLCIVHRFLGHRIPEHRVTLFEKCTDALLYEWDRAKFPPGAAMGQLDAREKRVLLRGVARRMHEDHAAEIAEAEARRQIESALPDLGYAASDAREIIDEIRDRSGLLVERRPGFFAFSHLTFQEYLTALAFADRKDWKELVDRFEDPWWEEVIPLAAGAPGADAGAIAAALLDKGGAKAVVMAAQCVDTAIDLPLTVRKRVEKALQQYIPPSDAEGYRRLVRVGVMAAPLMLKALSSASAESKTWTLLALGKVQYQPSLPPILRCVSDRAPSAIVVSFNGTVLELSVGEVAYLEIARWAIHSDSALHALRSALGTAQRLEFLRHIRGYLEASEKPQDENANGKNHFLKVLDLLDQAIQGASAGKTSPKRAKSTG